MSGVAVGCEIQVLLAEAAVMFGEPGALHDTYYVVVHWHYALQILVTLLAILLLWRWMHPRLTVRWRYLQRAH